MRISARLDEDRSHKLEYLAMATSLGKSEILKNAIDTYYEKVLASRPRPAEAFQKAGFIGCGEAGPELSESYKKDLNELLSTKHGHR